MDRTSILSDSIDYMKELLERIKRLQEEIEAGSEKTNLFKELNPDDILARKSPRVGSSLCLCLVEAHCLEVNLIL